MNTETTPTLALDAALKTGFAWTDGEQLRSGVWLLDGSGSEHAGKPFVRLKDRIIGAHRAWGFERIVFEASAYGGDYMATKQFHNAARGVMLLTAAELELTWDEYNPTTIKKFATDNGHAKKPSMLLALHLQYPELTDVRSDDEVDAIWVLKLDQNRRNNPLVEAPKPRKKRRRRRKDPQLF